MHFQPMGWLVLFVTAILVVMFNIHWLQRFYIHVIGRKATIG